MKGGGCAGLQCAFPDDAHPPSEIQKARDDIGVPLPVRVDLRFPEFPARRGNGCKPTTAVPMPEATMDKDDGIATRKCQVRPAWKVPSRQTEPKPASMQEPPDDEFGFRVTAADGRHHPGSHSGGNNVSHASTAMPSGFLVVPVRARRAVSSTPSAARPWQEPELAARVVCPLS